MHRITMAAAAAVCLFAITTATAQTTRTTTTTTTTSSAPPPAPSNELPDPPFWRSVDGVFNRTLTPRVATNTVMGQTLVSNTYEGMYIPPVWRLKRGDKVQLRLVNRMSNPTPTATNAQAVAPHGKPQSIFQAAGVFRDDVNNSMAGHAHSPATTTSTAPPSPPAPPPLWAFTNLHYHGFTISPKAPADDVFLQINAPGYDGAPKEYNYSYTIPADHAQGLFWFHPHPHMLSEQQVLGGMAGSMIVEGLIEDQFPQYKGLRERVMILKDISFTGNKVCNPTCVTVNGTMGKTISIRPGEQQFWRIANISADAYVNLVLQGSGTTQVPFLLLAQDGNALRQPQSLNALYMPPGARMEVIVTGPAAGSYAFANTGVVMYNNNTVFVPGATLATMVSSGKAVTTPPPPSTPKNFEKIPPTPQQVKNIKPSRQCTFTFTQSDTEPLFYINGNLYDPNAINHTAKLGTVEIWKLVNASPELHTFHIHQLDFLVLSVNGVAPNPPFNNLQDTVNIPFQPQNGQPGEVIVAVPFLRPEMIGKFVYHCHILYHEDRGMMQTIVVTKDGKLPAESNCSPM